MREITISLILGALCSFTTQATEASCFRYEANIPLSEIDSRLGFSGNDMIRDFNDASQSVLFTWEDGTVTSSHWEFTPAPDTARIFIADYDDDCSDRVADLSVQGQLALKTDDGRIDAKWNTHLSSDAGDPRIGISLSISPQDPQELQGLPERLEGEHDATYIWLTAQDGQLNGAIFRTYLTDNHGTMFAPAYARRIAFIGSGLDVRTITGEPGFIWQKP